MHAVPALPSRATLGCNILWAVKRLFPLEQELGMMLHWESTGLALRGFTVHKAGEERQFGGWGVWLLAPGVDWICAIPPASLGHPGTSNVWPSAVSQERVPCHFFLPLIDRAL